MISPELKAKLSWRCRRGMLELDLIFNRFIQHGLYKLSESQCEDFQYLLEQPDPDLYAWFMGYEQPQDVRLSEIIEFIRKNDPLG